MKTQSYLSQVTELVTCVANLGFCYLIRTAMQIVRSEKSADVNENQRRGRVNYVHRECFEKGHV